MHALQAFFGNLHQYEYFNALMLMLSTVAVLSVWSAVDMQYIAIVFMLSC